MWLLGYLGWLLRCCYAVARVPRVVAQSIAVFHVIPAVYKCFTVEMNMCVC